MVDLTLPFGLFFFASSGHFDFPLDDQFKLPFPPETGVDTNAYTGTVSYVASGATTNYSVDLDSTSGLTVSGSGNTSVEFPVATRQEFKDIIATLENDGQFVGNLKNGQINGLYSGLTGDFVVEIGLSVIVALGDSAELVQ